MRKIIGVIFALLLALSFARAQYSINVKDYCKPDDGIDDTQGLTSAIIAAGSGATLFVPSGVYNVTKIKLSNWALKRFKMIGEPGTKITTSITSGTLLYVFGLCEGSGIENIFFENTHGIVTTQTGCIFLAGTSSNAIKNFTIKGCRFEGFSTAIGGQGVVGLTIDQNKFYAPQGHDNAQNNTQPAVFVWFADNSNGACYDVRVLNNDVDGYTGSDISKTTTKLPMDGFIYGTAYGVQIEGNITRDLGEEHYALAPQNVPGDYPVIISKNIIYGSEPGSARPGNYAMRLDCSNIKVFGNSFKDYTTGILCYSFDYPTFKQENISITGNTFYAAKSNIQEAVKVQGSETNPAANITIYGNDIYIDTLALTYNTSAISIYNSEKGNISENKVFQGKMTTGSFSFVPVVNERTTDILLYENDLK